jgi:hypothetical protein
LKKYLFSVLFFIIGSLILTSCEGKGKLVIKEPPNADVYINGKYVGKTPLVLELKEAPYDITVATSPFDEETKKHVWIYFDKTTELVFHPKPKGILEADSKPQGATVLDGKYPIGKTPLKKKLDVGEHLIVFKIGEAGASRRVNIEYGKIVKLFVNLEKAVIHFDANPKDAVLYIDGKEIGSLPKVVELDEGIHTIKVKKGVFESEFTLKFKKGEEKHVTYILEPVQLPPIQAYGPIQFTKDHKTLVTMGKAGIYFWDLAKLKPKFSLYDPEDVRNFDKFTRFSLSVDENFVAGVKPIKALAYKLKDKSKPATKILVWNVKTLSPVLNKIYTEKVFTIAFGEDNSKIYLIKKDGGIQKVDVKTGNIINKLKINDKITVAKNNNESVFIGTESGNVYILDSKTDEITKRINVHSGRINSLEISSDGKDLITASDDKTAKILSLSDLSVEKNFNFDVPIISANLSPNKTKFAVGKNDKTVTVISMENGSTLYTIKDLKAPPISVAFKDEDILITASSIKNPKIDLWEDGHLLKNWVQTIE